jgi:hypothetical protein
VCVRVYACAYRRAHMHTTAGRKRTRAQTHINAATHNLSHTVHSHTRQRGIEAPKVHVAEIKCAECPGTETCATYPCVHVNIAVAI